MVDMRALVNGTMGFIVAIVGITIGAVLTSKLGTTTGIGADAQQVAQNGTALLQSILNDWGPIIVLGLILLTVLIPLLFALVALSRRS